MGFRASLRTGLGRSILFGTGGQPVQEPAHEILAAGLFLGFLADIEVGNPGRTDFSLQLFMFHLVTPAPFSLIIDRHNPANKVALDLNGSRGE